MPSDGLTNRKHYLVVFLYRVPEPTDVVEPKRRKRREKRSKEERGKKRRLRLSSSGLQV